MLIFLRQPKVLKYGFAFVCGFFFYFLLKQWRQLPEPVLFIFGLLLARGLLTMVWYLSEGVKIVGRFWDRFTSPFSLPQSSKKGRQVEWAYPRVNLKKKTFEQLSLDSLLRRYGSPLFLVSKRVVVQKYRLLSRVLRRWQSRVRVAYSIKTNNVMALCQVLKQEGAMAEVVSDFEYRLAKKLGYRDQEIIFNGPYKERASLRRALLGGAMVHIDNWEEFYFIARVARARRSPVSVGVRVNTLVQGRRSRFGFDLENGEAMNVCRMIKKERFLKLTGIHCHLGSNISEPVTYRLASTAVSGFIRQLNAEGFLVDYLDFGGGFPVFGSEPTDTLPGSIEAYIRAIVQPLRRSGLEQLRLILEPGRFLVDQAMVLVATVLDAKQTAHQENILVDASIHILPLAQWRAQRVDLLASFSPAEVLVTTIYGASCVESDWLVKNAWLPKVKRGDLGVFYNAGAYNVSQSSQFIYPRPGVVMVDNGKATLIRKPERDHDLLRLEIY